MKLIVIKKKSIFIVIILLLKLGLIHYCSADHIDSVKTIFVDDDNIIGPWDGTQKYPFRLIQDAINYSCDGDSILVFNGTYNENVLVNRSINIQGEKKETTIIEGNGSDKVIFITANSCNISGFTIRNGNTGIYMFTESSTITENICKDNNIGIGCTLSSYNLIKSNLCINNNKGIRFDWHSGNNTITQNKIINNKQLGISIRLNSNDNIISHNSIENNRLGIELEIVKFNTIIKNNFLKNIIQADFYTTSHKLLKRPIYLDGNYWGRSRILPKIFFGELNFILHQGWGGRTDLKWIYFDLHPSSEPYDIDLIH